MFSHDHLALRLVRLKTGEKWTRRPTGLVFIFPQAGSGTYRTGTTEEHVSAGDVLVLNEVLSATLVGDGTEGITFWFFAVTVEQMYPLFSVGEICLLQNVAEELKSARHSAGSSPLAVSCHRMLSEAPEDLDVNHRSQLLRIAALILSNEFKNARTHRIGLMRSDENVMRVFEGLSTQELLNLSVAELAARFNCSKRHLNRLFHQHFGFSVAGMRMEMRLLKAVSLLRDSYAKIINVAEQCGFNHLGLFNTCFKRRFSMSPGQWRKRETENRDSSVPGGIQTCPLKMNGLCPLAGQPDTPQVPQRPPAPGQRTASARLLVTLKGLTKSAAAGSEDVDNHSSLSFRTQIVPPRETRLGP